MMNRISIGELGAYGFGAEITGRLVSAGVTSLLPLQADAVQQSGLLRGANVLALAPTSAGKTFVGEMAALRHWQAGRKAVFLSPTRALTAEQFRHLRERYEAAGIRVVMSTADQTQHDARIRKGEFDIAVMVYEKFRSMLVSCPDLVYSVGVVVADELQILNDRERGETADLLLTRLAHGEPRVQVVGLSAVMDGAEPVAEWLDAELLRSSVRPTDLREGIYCAEHGAFHYRSSTSAEWADENLPGEDAASDGGGMLSRDVDGAAAMVGLAVRLARAGENCLVFLPTRAATRQFALAVARELGIAAEGERAACGELLMAEESAVRQQLLRCMPAGVAFHNSDLTADLRGQVERGFNEGRIRVLAATPTLAQGVNLRAKNVIQLPIMINGDGSGGSGRPVQTPLSVERYRNQAGRAGRVGAGDGFGRSVLIARGHADAVRLARGYIEAEVPAPMRGFCAGSLEQFVLDFVDSGMAATFSGICDALKLTFSWKCEPDGREGLEEQLAECVKRLLDFELMDESAGHRLRLTALGQVAAAGGYQAETMREMLAWCDEWKVSGPSDFEVLMACAFTADGEVFPVMASQEEIRSGRWLRAAQDALRRERSAEGGAAQAALWPRGGLARAGHGAAKLAVVSAGWISRRETAELEDEFRTIAGTMAAGAAHLAWLAAGLGGCARVAGCADATVKLIERLAMRLPAGLAEGAARLAGLQVPGITRNYLHRLMDAGFDSVAALASAEPGALEGVLPRALVERLRDAVGGEIGTSGWIARTRKLTDGPQSTDGPDGPLQRGRGEHEAPETLEARGGISDGAPLPLSVEAGFADETDYDLILDGSNPGTVVFRGREVLLSPKPYALLGVLADCCGTTVSYRQIDERVWPDEKVEPQQVSAHKSRLVRELAKATSREEAERVIVTAPRFGVRLNLSPGRVLVSGREAAVARVVAG